MYIILAILAFGILVAVHELGHFTVAKACGVKVNEFSIGMGPAIFKKQGRETLYSLRCLPIGGFCAMEGENEDTGDERGFIKQAAWKRVLILVAGAAMNFLLGLIVIMLLNSNVKALVTNRVDSLIDGFKYAENGIQAGDEIISIDGHRIFYVNDFTTYISRSDGVVDMVVIRDGKKVKLENYELLPQEYTIDGQSQYRYGLNMTITEINLAGRLKYSLYTAYNFVRMIEMGLADLFTGNAGINDLSGVVGIVDTMNQVAEESDTRSEALGNIAYLCAFIAINLAVMNLLPLPALDGGRIFFILINAVSQLIFKKKIPAKYESYVHAAGLVILMGLMVYVMVNDIIKIVR